MYAAYQSAWKIVLICVNSSLQWYSCDVTLRFYIVIIIIIACTWPSLKTWQLDFLTSSRLLEIELDKKVFSLIDGANAMTKGAIRLTRRD